MSPKDDTALQPEDEVVFLPHTLPVTKLVHVLGTDALQGLTSTTAEERMITYGSNTLPRVRPSFWRVYLAPIFNGLILIYLASILLLILLREFEQSVFWLVIIAFNMFLAIIQQYRAEKKLEALQALTADTHIVLRDGTKQKIDTSLIVPGDVIILAQGDRIPADSRIIAANNLTIVESSLTGESAPVTKSDTEASSEVPLHARTNMVYRGTYVATGSGQCIVTATGQNTEIGKISRGLETLATGDIPLRRKVNRLAIYLAIGVLILLITSLVFRVLPLIVLMEPIESVRLAAINAVTIAMTVCPINIPLLTTITLLTGVLAMAEHGVIVRNLSAVESLGRVSIICTDKTGTLTRSEMVVSLAWDGEHLYKISGEGYSPTGEIYLVERSGNRVEQVSETPVKLAMDSKLALLIRIGGLNNDAEINIEKSPDDGEMRWVAVGNPTEAALLALYRKSGLTESSLLAYQVVHNFPFDSHLKRMTRVFTHPSGGYVAFVKGATAVLLSRCTHIGDEHTTQKLTDKRRKAIAILANQYAAGGYRVLSFALRHLTKLPKATGEKVREKFEQHLTYVGFVAIVDPPREGAREAVQECARAGIKTIMVTGDALATARTIGRQLDIVREDDLVVEGKQATEVTDEKFQQTSVFARVNPDDKQVIVQRYQETGKAVAVTGDGVNDALALSISDVGIAMGITGTDVAKEAADMIIADDSFISIVEGVRQGRSLFNKIRMMIFFYIAINFAESILFYSLYLIGFEFLTTYQHIFLTITSHSWPGLALVFDRPAKNVMQEAPRNTEAIINRRLAGYLVLNSFMIFIGVTITYFFTWTSILPGSTHFVPYSAAAFQKAQIMSITVLLFAETLMILSIRRINQSVLSSIRRESYWLIYIMIAFVFLMHWGLMYIPEAAIILGNFGIDFGYVTLTSFDWIIAFTLALPTIVGMEVAKWVSRKRGVTY